MKYEVSVFKPYPFRVGQKIRIENSPRAGDWEVVGVSEHNIKLRCPISHKEYEWTKFCYVTDEEADSVWPRD